MTSERTIAIVGASRGIGMALVELLAADAHNRILAFSRNEEKMLTAFDHLINVSCFHLDLSSENLKTDFFEHIKDIDKIDILINNAGYLVNKAFPELSHTDFIRSYQVNVIGIMECVQAILPKMKTGHIVNISSMGGFQGSVKFPGLAAYSTSKAALCSFTELFAEEYKGSGIKMNCLCLGAVQTEMLEEAFPGYEAVIKPEEMAKYIAHFALTADKWINGKIIPVSLSTP